MFSATRLQIFVCLALGIAVKAAPAGLASFDTIHLRSPTHAHMRSVTVARDSDLFDGGLSDTLNENLGDNLSNELNDNFDEGFGDDFPSTTPARTSVAATPLTSVSLSSKTSSAVREHLLAPAAASASTLVRSATPTARPTRARA